MSDKILFLALKMGAMDKQAAEDDLKGFLGSLEPRPNGGSNDVDILYRGDDTTLLIPHKQTYKDWKELHRFQKRALEQSEEAKAHGESMAAAFVDLTEQHEQELKMYKRKIQELKEENQKLEYDLVQHQISTMKSRHVEDTPASQAGTTTPPLYEEVASSSVTPCLSENESSPKKRTTSPSESKSATAKPKVPTLTLPNREGYFKKEEVPVQKTSRHKKARGTRGSTGLAKDGSTVSSRMKTREQESVPPGTKAGSTNRTKSTDRAPGRDVGKHNATAPRNRSSSVNAPAQQNRPVQLMRGVSPNAAPTIYNFNPHQRAPSTHRLQLAPTYTAPRRSEEPSPNPRRSI